MAESKEEILAVLTEVGADVDNIAADQETLFARIEQLESAGTPVDPSALAEIKAAAESLKAKTSLLKDKVADATPA